jgi:hypothetical protein
MSQAVTVMPRRLLGHCQADTVGSGPGRDQGRMVFVSVFQWFLFHEIVAAEYRSRASSEQAVFQAAFRFLMD